MFDAGAPRDLAELRRLAEQPAPQAKWLNNADSSGPSARRMLRSVLELTMASTKPAALSSRSMASQPGKSGAGSPSSVARRRMCRAMKGSFQGLMPRWSSSWRAL